MEDTSKSVQPPSTPLAVQNREEAAKQSLTTPSEPRGNQGWDNEHSDLILHEHDVLHNDVTNNSYRVMDKLGQGTFGQVVRCYSQQHRCLMAVKVIKNEEAYHQQAMVEVKILQSLNRCYDANRHNFVRLFDYFRFRKHLCLVFELLKRNLFEVIRFSGYQGFSLSLVHHFIKQVIQTLLVLRKERMIHCDLKLENILMEDERNGIVKVIDFGSACMEHETVYSYIQSRFYRAPEVVLAHPYDSAIDMWSLGCVAAELYLGLPLFPADSEHDLLARMVEILGPFPVRMLGASRRVQRYFKLAPPSEGDQPQFSDAHGRVYQLLTEAEFENRNHEKAPTARKYFKDSRLEDIILKSKTRSGNSPSERLTCFLDFLSGLLEVDPRKRWNAEQASAHPFITKDPFHAPFQPPRTVPVAMSMPVGIGGMPDARYQSASWHPNAAAAHSIAHEAAMRAVNQYANSVASNSSFPGVGSTPMMQLFGSVSTLNGMIGATPETNPMLLATARAAQEAFSNPSCPSSFQPNAKPAASRESQRISGFDVAPRQQSNIQAPSSFSDPSQGQPSLHANRHSLQMAHINEYGPVVDSGHKMPLVSDGSQSSALQFSHLQQASFTSLGTTDQTTSTRIDGGQGVVLGNSVPRQVHYSNGNRGGDPRQSFASGPSHWNNNASSTWQRPILSEHLHELSIHSSQNSSFSAWQRTCGMPFNVHASSDSCCERRELSSMPFASIPLTDTLDPTTFSQRSHPWNERISTDNDNSYEIGFCGVQAEENNERQDDWVSCTIEDGTKLGSQSESQLDQQTADVPRNDSGSPQRCFPSVFFDEE